VASAAVASAAVASATVAHQALALGLALWATGFHGVCFGAL